MLIMLPYIDNKQSYPFCGIIFPINSYWLASNSVLLQPAIYVTSLAAVELFRVRDGGQQIIDSVDVTCGLSLGEYTALAFAGAFR